MTNNSNNNKYIFNPPESIQRKIGNTTYTLRAHFKPDAREGLLDKLWRLIRNDDSSIC